MKHGAVILAAISAGCAFTTSAGATEFLEWRLGTGVRAQPDRLGLDASLGAAWDCYVDSDFGVRLGGDALVASELHPGDTVPGALALSPELAVFFAPDHATRRIFVVARPLAFRVLNFESGGTHNVLLRTEVGAEHEWRAEDGGLRFRVGAFYSPGASFADAHWLWDGFALKITIAWAKPPPALPPPRPLGPEEL